MDIEYLPLLQDFRIAINDALTAPVSYFIVQQKCVRSLMRNERFFESEKR